MFHLIAEGRSSTNGREYLPIVSTEPLTKYEIARRIFDLIDKLDNSIELKIDILPAQ